jgi:hypothetical protein
MHGGTPRKPFYKTSVNLRPSSVNLRVMLFYRRSTNLLNYHFGNQMI